MNADDQRLADLVRLVRHELRLTQIQLGTAAHVPVRDIKAVEGGRAADVRVGRLRRILEAQDGRLRVTAWWKGAAGDQLLDRRHAALVERVVTILRARGWNVHIEVSFSEFGERGSIDVLALRPDAKVAVVLEIKTVLGSLEETNRVFDAKVRLTPTIVYRRFGWRPVLVGCVLVLPEESTVRRTIEQHAETMQALYPSRGREVRAWVRRPSGPLRGLWFLSYGRNTTDVSR